MSDLDKKSFYSEYLTEAVKQGESEGDLKKKMNSVSKILEKALSHTGELETWTPPKPGDKTVKEYEAPYYEDLSRNMRFLYPDLSNSVFPKSPMIPKGFKSVISPSQKERLDSGETYTKEQTKMHHKNMSVIDMITIDRENADSYMITYDNGESSQWVPKESVFSYGGMVVAMKPEVANKIGLVTQGDVSEPKYKQSAEVMNKQSKLNQEKYNKLIEKFPQTKTYWTSTQFPSFNDFDKALKESKKFSKEDIAYFNKEYSKNLHGALDALIDGRRSSAERYSKNLDKLLKEVKVVKRKSDFEGVIEAYKKQASMLN